MSHSHGGRGVAVCLACLTFISTAWAAGDRDKDAREPIRVMTQNLYVGADLMRIVNEEIPDLIPVRVAETLAMIKSTDFPARAQKIADQIGKTHPDVIGLQEVSLLRTQFPGDYLVGNPVAANDVLYDYLDILLHALATHDLRYRVAAIVQNADVEVPALAGFDEQGAPLFMDVRLTDHDVLLTRRGLKIWNVTAENYLINLQIPLGIGYIEFIRGYVAVDMRVRDQVYRVVNTHLELPGPGALSLIQSMQTQELVTTLAYSPLPIVLLGDFNSAPEDPFDASGATPPYWQLTANNFVDVWLPRQGKPNPGYTCCQDESLSNTDSMLFMRIDHVFMRSPDGDASLLDNAKVHAITVGDEAQDKTDAGLWPSDHAGVAAQIQFFAAKHGHDGHANHEHEEGKMVQSR